MPILSDEFVFRSSNIRKTLLEKHLSQGTDFTDALYKVTIASIDNHIKNLKEENIEAQNTSCLRSFENIFERFEKGIIVEKATKCLGGFAYDKATTNLLSELEWNATNGIDKTVWEEVKTQFDTLLVRFIH